MLVPLSVLLVASTPWDTPNNTLFHTSTYVPKTYISPFRNPHMYSLLCVWKPYVIASTFHPGMCAWPVMMATPSGACRYTADLLTYGALMKLWRLGSLYVCTYCMYTTTLPVVLLRWWLTSALLWCRSLTFLYCHLSLGSASTAAGSYSGLLPPVAYTLFLNGMGPKELRFIPGKPKKLQNDYDISCLMPQSNCLYCGSGKPYM